MKTILFRTLSMIANINVDLNNFQAARQAIRDLECLQKYEADTYILKIKVLLSFSFSETNSSENVFAGGKVTDEFMETIYALYKCDNFHFAHLLVVMYEADQIRLSQTTQAN